MTQVNPNPLPTTPGDAIPVDPATGQPITPQNLPTPYNSGGAPAPVAPAPVTPATPSFVVPPAATPGTPTGTDPNAPAPASFGPADLAAAVADTPPPPAAATGTSGAAATPETGVVPGATGGNDPGAQAVAFARQALGTPYLYGGTDPQHGIDCSGLVQWAYAKAGINLPRVTYDQVNVGLAVGSNNAQPGDLVFMPGDVGMRHFGHVGIYIGAGQMIVAPHTGASVRIENVPWGDLDAIRRPWAAAETRNVVAA